MSRLIEKCSKLKESSTLLSAASTSSKNSALQLVADGLKNNTEYILTENVKDVEAAVVELREVSEVRDERIAEVLPFVDNDVRPRPRAVVV